MEQLLRQILDNQTLILSKLANLQKKRAQTESQFGLKLFNTNEVYSEKQLTKMKKRVHLHAVVYSNSNYVHPLFDSDGNFLQDTIIPFFQKKSTQVQNVVTFRKENIFR